VIDSDYTGEVNVVLANLGDKPYRVDKGDQIAQLIIKKTDKRELQEVIQLDDTKTGYQGFGSTDTTMHQRVTGQKGRGIYGGQQNITKTFQTGFTDAEERQAS